MGRRVQGSSESVNQKRTDNTMGDNCCITHKNFIKYFLYYVPCHTLCRIYLYLTGLDLDLVIAV